MQAPNQPPAGQPVFPDSGSGAGFDYPGYGAQPPPGQPIAPPYGNAVPPSTYYAYAPAYGQSMAAPQTSGFAIASLLCSIASWFFLPFIGGVLAVIFGRIARQEIRRSQGRKRGNGLLLAGLVIGYIHIAVAIVIGVVFLWLVIAFASDGYRF